MPVIKKYGIDASMEPFMDDLQELEQVSLELIVNCQNRQQYLWATRIDP